MMWAKDNFKKVFAITFDYGQRHNIEINSAKKIAKLLKIPLKIHKIEIFKGLTKNALTDKKVPIKAGKNGTLPTTFVEGRNLIFLAAAAIYAKSLKIKNLVGGFCQADYSGYPDCRENFVKSMEKTIELAMDHNFRIFTPLMWKTKAGIVDLMKELNGLKLLAHTHTCYEGKKKPCKKCPACLLRIKGFKEAEMTDPLKH
ncbi:MAG: 7-cyano-7-deazaguanine synthase QueC [Candidatus Gracilibacteria bacterium]